MSGDQLDGKISALDQRISGWFTKKDGAFWKETWALVKEIGANFKGTRYPSREEHQAAWNRFQGLVSKMKAESEQHRREREEQSGHSTAIKTEVASLAHRAWPRANGFEEIALLLSGVTPIAAMAKSVMDAFLGVFGLEDKRNALQKRHDELKEFSGYMKEAWNYFDREKGRLMGRDKAECFKVLQGVSNELQSAWDEWKQENERHFTERRQHHEEQERAFERKRDLKYGLIRQAERLDPSDREAGNIAKCLMNEWKGVGFAGRDHEDGLWADFQNALNAFWESRKSAKRDRLTEVLGNKQEHRQKLLGWISRDEGKLEEFKEKRDSARSDGFRDKMQAIVEDIESRIDENRAKLAEVESAIEDIERTLRDLD